MERRQLLRAGAGATVGALCGLAGCGVLAADETDFEAEYTEWLHAPGDVAEADHYGIGLSNPSVWAAKRTDFADPGGIAETQQFTRDRFYPTELTAEDMTQAILTHAGMVARGGFDTSDVADRLSEHDFDVVSEHGQFTIYENDEMDGTFVVGSDAVVDANGFQDLSAVELAEVLVEVRRGDRPGYVDTSDAMDLLTTGLPAGFETAARTYAPTDEHRPGAGVLENSLGIGMGATIWRDVVVATFAVAFESPTDATTAVLEEFMTGRSGTNLPLSDLVNVQYSTEGRLGTITGRIPIDEMDGFHFGGSGYPRTS